MKSIEMPKCIEVPMAKFVAFYTSHMNITEDSLFEIQCFLICDSLNDL